jgi:hypothetical protein
MHVLLMLLLQVSMLQPGQPSSVLTQQQFEQQKAELKDKTAICYW